MEIKDITKEEYQKIVAAKIVFDSAAFNDLNKNKVDKVHYLISKDSKNRFGMCAGQKEDTIMMPFSAPFSLVEPIKDNWTLGQLEETISCLVSYAQCEKWKNISITLPPVFYDTSLITSIQNILVRMDFRLCHIDLNYAFKLQDVYVEQYMIKLQRNARKNLAIAMKSALEFVYCDTEELIMQAYDIIADNRKSKGYPLRMSYEQVRNTIDIIEHEFFIVKHKNENVASAQIFHITNDIVQVIYWGDRPGYSELKPINYLAYQLIQFYGEKGFAYLDIGPSSEDGVPNYGLCDFKTSIGCEISPKLKFVKEIDCYGKG